MTILNLAVLALSEGGKGGLLDVNPGLIIWTVITFICLLILLRVLAWKPILSALSEREKFIKDSLDKAEKAQKDAEQLMQENQARLAKSEEEAQKIIAQGRVYSEKLKNQMLEESKSEAKKMIEQASSEIERKNQEAFNSLKSQIADIAINAAEKIIKESLDKEKHSKIVDKYIDEISKN